jgi:hypothetical protein
MIVVFDTNVWLSELALNTPAGAAVRFFLLRQNAVVAVPEVVELELRAHLAGQLREMVASIRSNYGRLLTVFGELKELVLPDEAGIQARVDGVIADLDVPTRRIGFTLESARASFLKTVDKLPPSSDKNQQFKDGVIWADCIGLLQEDDVYLVTNDRGFYECRDVSKGLARSLASEAGACSHELYLMPSIFELLDDIRQDVAVDEGKLVDTLLERYSESLDQLLGTHGFAIQSTPTVVVRLFATDLASRPYLEFEAVFTCDDALQEDREPAVLTLSGTGLYDASTGEFVDLRMDHETLDFVSPEGEQQAKSVWAGAISFTLGHASALRKTRYPL